jgi:antitoxin VapB
MAKFVIKDMAFETIEIKNKKGGQAITLPRGMEINDSKAYLKRVGNTIHIIPFHNPWQNMIEGVDLFTPDFMENRNQSSEQKRESLD